MKLIESEKFIKKAHKLIKQNKYLDSKLEGVLEKLKVNPFDGSLRTHKLKGILANLYSASITHDIRIIFDFVEEDNELCILLLSIGKHDEVY